MALTACSSAPVAEPASGASSPPGGAGTSTVPRGGVVSVTVTVTGLLGGDVAGVLTPGDGVDGSRVDESVGGFHLLVTSDRFTATATVDTPMAELRPGEPFPYVTAPPVLVPTGTYRLTVWADRAGLGPYSR